MNGNGAARQLTPQEQNIYARQTCIRQGVDMCLPIFARTYTAVNNDGPGTVISLPIRNVGLVKRFIVEITGLITPAGTALRTFLGGGNFFSSVVFTDLSNQQRISTQGWHLQAIASAKRRRPYASTAALDEPDPFQVAGVRLSNPYGYGNNTDAVFLPASIAAATPFSLFFEVPLAYTDHDLRGAIYANVTNATANLQLTVNPTMFLAPGARNAQRAMMTSASAVTLTNFTVTVYQNFLDQLPIAQQGGPLLPLLDLSTAYLLNNTAVTGNALNQDNPIPYANFRDFMSTCVIYDDPAEFNDVTSAINYWALQSANYTNIFKYSPKTNYLMSRLTMGDDFPLGMYYFDYRNKPVSTIQYGNMQLIANPVTVTDNQSNFLVGFESLALINMITQAGSLYGS